MASNHTFASANRRHVRHKPSGCTFIAAAVRGLHLVCPAGLLLDLLRQSLVSRSNFLHRLPGVRVAHRLGLGKEFLGACSPATNEHQKLRVPNVTTFAFGRLHRSPPRGMNAGALNGAAKARMRAESPYPHRVPFNASTLLPIWGHFLDRNVSDVRHGNRSYRCPLIGAIASDLRHLPPEVSGLQHFHRLVSAATFRPTECQMASS